MDMKSEIYQTDNRIANGIKRLENSQLSENNIQALKQFKTELLAEGLSGHRVNALIQSFNSISHLIDFDLKNPSREDLLQLVTEINQNNVSKKNYSVWTLCEYKKALKRFYQWDTGRKSPEVIEFINTHPKESEKPKTDKEELLTVRMVEELINACGNARDMALLGMLWDSGARISELLSLEWRDINIKDDCMSVHLREGKNGPRKIFLVESIPLVRNWRSEYPGRPGPDDSVWVALRQGGREEKRQMTYRAVNSQLSRIRSETSIHDRVKTNPHAWRKARATDLAGKGMSQANLNLWFGWVPGSDKSRFYIMLAQSDLEAAFRRIYPGLEEKQNSGPSFLGENIPIYNQSDLRAYQENSLGE